MRIFNPTLVITIAALWACSVHAAPGNASDDMDNLLPDNGFLSQMDQVRQNVSHKASELVVNAMGFIGVPYKMGGNSVETGFDCSGFVRSVYQQSIGLLLPRRAEEQALATQQIEKHDLQPGDLVFFNTMRRTFSHVGIYVGENKFIHSPKPGGEVRLENMGLSYWQQRFDGARRVLASASARTAILASGTAARVLKPQALTSEVLKSAEVKKRDLNQRSVKQRDVKQREVKKRVTTTHAQKSSRTQKRAKA